MVKKELKQLLVLKLLFEISGWLYNYCLKCV